MCCSRLIFNLQTTSRGTLFETGERSQTVQLVTSLQKDLGQFSAFPPKWEIVDAMLILFNGSGNSGR